MIQSTRVTLAEISYDVAAKKFPSTHPFHAMNGSMQISPIELAQQDYLAHLNRLLNNGQIDAVHVVNGRRFVHGVDIAADDDSRWLVDDENCEVAYSLLLSVLPAGVPISSAVNSNLVEPARRLLRLQELGGKAICRRGRWRFTGIDALIAIETAEGRGRCSDKTIRKDLIEAAEELEQHRRAGGSGLASRRSTNNAFTGCVRL
jgi:hypothetical protein